MGAHALRRLGRGFAAGCSVAAAGLRHAAWYMSYYVDRRARDSDRPGPPRERR